VQHSFRIMNEKVRCYRIWLCVFWWIFWKMLCI